MADDELILPIDKAFWPKGAMRGLTPILRQLGDKHGNLVIAAVPNKHIMVKGDAARIEEVKVPLRELIEEHFPDAPIPEELGGEGEGGEEEGGYWEEEPAEPEPPEKAPKTEPKPEKTSTAAKSEAAPKAPASAPAPEPAKKGGLMSGLFGGKKKEEPAAAVKPVPAGPPPKPVKGRKQPRPTAMAAPDLLWECMKKNSSFLRKPNKELRRPFNAEPCNLLGIHSQKFSGLAASEALDVRPLKVGKKQSIELVQSHAKTSRHRRPSSAKVTIGLSKCPKHGLARLDREVDAKFYRRDLHSLARAKYVKVQQSFKTKKRIVKSRKSKNSA